MLQVSDRLRRQEVISEDAESGGGRNHERNHPGVYGITRIFLVESGRICYTFDVKSGHCGNRK